MAWIGMGACTCITSHDLIITILTWQPCGITRSCCSYQHLAGCSCCPTIHSSATLTTKQDRQSVFSTLPQQESCISVGCTCCMPAVPQAAAPAAAPMPKCIPGLPVAGFRPLLPMLLASVAAGTAIEHADPNKRHPRYSETGCSKDKLHRAITAVQD